MLPKSVETPRGLELQAILAEAAKDPRGLDRWPMLTEKDYVAIGGIVVLFSYIDFNLRRILEAFDRVSQLKAPWKGRTGKLPATEVAAAIQSLDVWDDAGRKALAELEELRFFRNLVAHFAIRRFPNDNAYLFIAKSERDFRRVFNQAPPLGVALTAIVDYEDVTKAVHRIEHVQNWIGRCAPRLENALIPAGI